MPRASNTVVTSTAPEPEFFPEPPVEVEPESPNDLQVLLETVNSLRQEVALLREGRKDPHRFDDTPLDVTPQERVRNTPLPVDRGEYPVRVYSPKYLYQEVSRTDSRYPIKFQNGEALVWNEAEDDLMKRALGQDYFDYSDNMPTRQPCETCGFSTFNSQAWMDHLKRGPHAIKV